MAEHAPSRESAVCAHENVRTLRSVPSCSFCQDCGDQVEMRWTSVHQASIAAELWDEGMTAHTDGLGSDDNPYRRPTA